MQIGWSIAIETTNGIVGMWTCWLGNRLKLFYPLDIKISDELIMQKLNVTLAQPVANGLFGERLWEKFYSEKLEEGGRVWIGQEAVHSSGYSLNVIRNQRLESHYCGGNRTNTIFTHEFNFYSKTEPEAPNCRPKNIQVFKERFVQLLVEVAKQVGDIVAVNLDSGLVLYTPSFLQAKGYEMERWKDRYTEYCYTKKGNYEIMLKSGNSSVSWSTIFRYPASNRLTAEEIIHLIDSFDNSEISFNPVPLISYFVKQEALYKNY